MITTLRNWQNIIKKQKDLIFCASEYRFSQDVYVPYPIGISNRFVEYPESIESIQIGNHEKTVLCMFAPETDQGFRINKNRISIEQTLKDNNIINKKAGFDLRGYIFKDNVFNYFNSLKDYKFNISPEGHGVDTHRHYESIVVGTIPVIEYSDEINQKYYGCPILWTDNYSEINEKYLLNKYEEMVDQEFDFSKVFMYNYSLEHQKEIIDHSNYWVGDGRMGKSFYE
jgi:hypothetical protein